MTQLARALRHPGLELRMLSAHFAFGALELLGHVIERAGEHVHFVHAAARHARTDVACRQPTRGFSQTPHGPTHTRHGDDGDHEQQQQHEHTAPGQLSIRLCSGLLRELVGIGERNARRSHQLSQHIRPQRSGLIAKVRRALLQVGIHVEDAATPTIQLLETVLERFGPDRAFRANECGGITIHRCCEGRFTRDDRLKIIDIPRLDRGPHTLLDDAQLTQQLLNRLTGHALRGAQHALDFAQLLPVRLRADVMRLTRLDQHGTGIPERVEILRESGRRGIGRRSLSDLGIVSRGVGDALGSERNRLGRARAALRLIHHDAFIDRDRAGE